MASTVIDELKSSDDAVEHELAQALLKWQDDKASQGLARSLGYEPKEIREKGAVAVIEARVLKGSSGFDEIDQEASYEAIVDRHPNRFRDEVVAAARRRLQKNSPASFQITPDDIRLIKSSRAKRKFSDLTNEEREAYLRVSSALESLGNLLKSNLSKPNEYEIRTTAGFNIKSGIRGFVPKDLWFGICAKSNVDRLASNPQVFMIVSERGLELGYAATTHTADFSNPTLKEKVRAIAPKIYERLPSPGSDEAEYLSEKLSEAGDWRFRKKSRQPVDSSDFRDLHSWLSFLKSPQGASGGGGTISRYISPDELESVDLEQEVIALAHAFEDLLLRDWSDHVEADLFSSSSATVDEPAELPSTKPEEAGREAASMSGRRVWVEKCLVKGRSDRQFGPHRLGEALWSPQRDKNGRDIYANMREVSPGDIVLHLTDNSGFTGISEVAETAEDSFQGLAGTAWADMPAYRVQLRNFRPLEPELPRSEFLAENDVGNSLLMLLDTPEGRGLFYNRNLEFNQGAYLSEASPTLVSLLNQAYNQIAGKKLLDLPNLPKPPTPPAAPAPVYTIEDALGELFLEREDVERYLDIWTHKKNMILQGAPGVGKSFIARRLAYALIGFKDDRKVQTVQFHQSYSYEDFVQGYRPDGSQGFERKNGTFYEFRDRALRDPDGKYVFIIDEINRGNLSKIFGELMLLIEPDKRGPIWKTKLAYATEDDPEFYVPENLFILGMMNTADRSLSLVDYALRRRFAFVAMVPLYGAPKFRAHLEAHSVPEDVITRIVNGMGELNQAIESDRTNLGPGFRIGHSFFTPTKRVADPEGWYKRIVETEIHPLLEEYWFDAPETADQWRDQLLR